MSYDYSQLGDYTKYENKVKKFFNASKHLYDGQYFNCATNRIYYTFVQLGLRNASLNKAKQCCYFVSYLMFFGLAFHAEIDSLHSPLIAQFIIGK